MRLKYRGFSYDVTGKKNIISCLFQEVVVFIFLIFISKYYLNRPGSILGNYSSWCANNFYFQNKYHKRFPVFKAMCLTASNLCPVFEWELLLCLELPPTGDSGHLFQSGINRAHLLSGQKVFCSADTWVVSLHGNIIKIKISLVLHYLFS